MSLPLVVIPVFNAFEHLQACLAALESASPGAEILVVEDASTDERVLPLLRAWKARSPRHHLLLQEKNRGFVNSANRGMARAGGDVVLLNSDTEVSEGWLEALARCLASAPDIATATPWTNNGEIASVPGFCTVNPPPPNRDAVGRALAQHMQARYPELPTAVGFCMAISRAALERIGPFDEDTFGYGYGEENDFCLRAAQHGLRNVLCDDAYVVHHGGASFGPRGLAPGEDSMRRLLGKHPAYLDQVSRFIREDPLAADRQAFMAALARAGARIG